LTRLDDLQSQTNELNYQLREKDELIAMIQVELSEARKSPSLSGSRTGMGGRGSTGGGGTADMAKLLSEAESRSEARLSELRTRIKTIEAERHEAEENWSKTLASRGEEIERLRNLLRDKEREWREVSEFRAIKEKEVASLTEEVEELQTQLQSVNGKMEDVRREGEVMRENLGNRSFEVNDLKSRLEAANNLVDEYKGKESQLKVSNKVRYITAFVFLRILTVHLSRDPFYFYRPSEMNCEKFKPPPPCLNDNGIQALVTGTSQTLDHQ
jgi:chromosome segregation ATPase